MPDTMTAEQRRRCMSRIRGRDTKPEMIVRRWLWSEGWRYRLYVKGFPGKPDIVFRKMKTVIFVNGCFWHGHNVKVAGIDNENCGVVELTDSDCCKIPHSNRDFWLKKITKNKTRDYQNYAVYLQKGWRVLVVWECMLKPKTREATLVALSQRLNSIFLESVRKQDGDDNCSKVIGRNSDLHKMSKTSKPYAKEDEDCLMAAEPDAEYSAKPNSD